MTIELNREALLANGGNLWEKGSLSRIYLTDQTLIAMGFEISKSLSGAGQKINSIGKNKVWFDLNTSTLHSDKGMLRTQLNAFGFECSK